MNETQFLVAYDVKNGEKQSGADVERGIPLGIGRRGILWYIFGEFPYGGTQRYAKPKNRYGGGPKRLVIPTDSFV